MKEEINAKVIEILLDKYVLNILDTNMKITATKRGSLKNNILVGDIVGVAISYDKYMIEKVFTRKNSLIRPPVSNIDTLLVVVSIDSPKPDYILLDKELILCKQKKIEPIICINKVDLSTNNEMLLNEIKYIENTYTKLCKKIIYTSAKENIGIDELKYALEGSVSAFSGNSGVGKSSIVSKIVNMKNIEINEISKKTNKGKHTTKYVKLYELENNTYILDTPGFSSYELYELDYKKLRKYYSEYVNQKCEYEDCSHVQEGSDVCMVKKKVQEGLLDRGRYDRYVHIYLKLKEKYDKKYK